MDGDSGGSILVKRFCSVDESMVDVHLIKDVP